MSGLFSSPFSGDKNLVEATVTVVDPIRFVCQVRTVKGQYLNEVMWLLPTGGTGKSGMHLTPNLGDQVVISTSMGYPLILGCLPRVGLAQTTLTNVTGNELGVDAGNSSNLKNGYGGNPNKPSDLSPGDFVYTTETGSLFAILANGTLYLKASALASIALSRFDDLVRVVARNWERFSDVGQQTVANVKGRLYEFVGWDRKLSRSQDSIYELKDIIGDVVAGENLGPNPSSDVVVPVADNRVRKYSLEDQAGIPLMTETLTEDGKIVVIVSNVGVTTTTHDNSKWEARVVNGETSVITIIPGTITIDHNGVSTVVLNDSQINLTHQGAVVNLNGSGIQSTYSGHFINVDSSGVHLG